MRPANPTVFLLLLPLWLGTLGSSSRLSAQQVPDLTFDVGVARPAFAPGKGPVLAIDEAHRNFHTATGRYMPFANLAKNDGFHIERNTRAFTRAGLSRYQILVISNALGADDIAIYARSAFAAAESTVVCDWVKGGGSLLLIADHAPMGVAAEALARQLGVDMSKGFTEDPDHAAPAEDSASNIEFSRLNGLLGDHPITRGRVAEERISRVVAFTGQSLRGPAGSVALLLLGKHAFDHPSPTLEQAAAQPNPALAWRTAVTGLPTRGAADRAMGIVFTFGRGRVAVLGEAAMLSAQMTGAGPQVRPMGMNAPGNDNKRFALNLIRWLAGVLR